MTGDRLRQCIDNVMLILLQRINYSQDLQLYPNILAFDYWMCFAGECQQDGSLMTFVEANFGAGGNKHKRDKCNAM